MATTVNHTQQSPILYTKKNPKQREIDVIIRNIISENPDRETDYLRALVKEKLTANKKDLKLSDKQINKIIAQMNIEAFRDTVLQEMRAATEAANTVHPTAENIQANFASRPAIKPDANVATDYYDSYNSMSKAEKRVKTKPAQADAEATFYSQEFNESRRNHERAVEAPAESAAHKETKIERKLRKQNIDIHDVMPTSEQIAEEERQIIQSVQENTTGLSQEPYESSATKKAKKTANEQTSAFEHAEQRIRPNKQQRNAEYVTSQGQMTHEGRIAYNRIEATSQRAVGEHAIRYQYPESGVNWREVYADTLQGAENPPNNTTNPPTPSSPSHNGRRLYRSHNSGSGYYYSPSPSTGGTNSVSNTSTTSSTTNTSTVTNAPKAETSSVSNAARNEADEAAQRAIREAEEAAKKNKRLKWIAGIGIPVAFIMGYIVGKKHNQKNNPPQDKSVMA